MPALAPLRARLAPLGPLLTAAAEALYPPVCISCRAEVMEPFGLCLDCWRDTWFIASPLCTRCGAPLQGATDAAFCDQCLGVPFAFDQARAATVYDGVARKLTLRLKHGDRLDLARPAAVWMQRVGAPLLARADLIVPVPLHWTRLLRRRSNQSAELARRLSAISGVPCAPDLLRRTRATGSQKGRSRADRRANLEGAFALARGRAHRIAGRRVLLIDDVFTTGATLSACAEALLAAGAAAVDALCLARVASDRTDRIVGASISEEPS